MRLRLLLLVILVVVFPATLHARKKEPAPLPQPAAAAGDLDSLTRRAPGVHDTASAAATWADPNIGPGESLVLADLTGPAVIDRIWIAVEGADTFWRDVILQITWDGGSAPSVEAPIGDFFAVGPGARQSLQSLPMAVQSAGRSFTSLWKMPFSKSARIVLRNEGASATRQLLWEVDYRKQDKLPDGSMFFHAQYTQAGPTEKGQPLTILRAARDTPA